MDLPTPLEEQQEGAQEMDPKAMTEEDKVHQENLEYISSDLK